MPSFSGSSSSCYIRSKMNNQQLRSVGSSFLCDTLRQGCNQALIFDCRDPSDFASSHIRGAINLALPTLVLRRLASGKMALSQVLRHLPPRDAEMTARLYSCVPIVLYDQIDANLHDPMAPVAALCRRLLIDGTDVAYLQGGFEEFQSQYPEWCESSSGDAPLVGLRSLRISPLSHEEACDSSLGRETPLDDLCFPVEILPMLYLGNAKNSGDREALNRHKIKYIVNVTPNLPNVFESSGSYKYMQIPIADHWSQNLASFFPKAIKFIDEARDNGVGVLVHCLAGISRSVTITVAYLMYKERLNLEDAYEYVRVKKANIAPNFNFMGQLQDFQQQLNLKCQCLSAECHCRPLHFLTPSHTSPDSGIEVDRFS